MYQHNQTKQTTDPFPYGLSLNETIFDTDRFFYSEPQIEPFPDSESLNFESGFSNELKSYPLFIEEVSEIRSTTRSSYSRSSSNNRDDFLQESLDSSHNPSSPKLRRRTSSKSTNSVNSKRRNTTEYSPNDDDEEFYEPKDKVKRIQKQPLSSSYPDFSPDELVDDILSLSKHKKHPELQQPKILSFHYSRQEFVGTESFQCYSKQDQTFDQSIGLTILTDLEETTNSSNDSIDLKQLVKNYIPIISNAFASILLEQGKDEKSEIYSLLVKNIEEVLPGQDDIQVKFHIESILEYTKLYIEGKEDKVTAKGKRWRQYKVSNKEAILEKFHPQIGDDSYIVHIKWILQRLIEEFFCSESYIHWATYVYKAKKDINRAFYKNKHNINEIKKVFTNAEKWKSSFVAPKVDP